MKASRLNPWVVLAFICIPVFVGSLDLTVVSAFLPELITELDLPFDTGLDDASWIVTGYLLAYTISLTFMGRLSDLIGRRGGLYRLFADLYRRVGASRCRASSPDGFCVYNDAAHG